MKSTRESKIGRGDLVEIEWLDASFYLSEEDMNLEALQAGGEKLISTGYVYLITPKCIVLVAELDGDRKPSRDFNLIPRKMIVSVERLRKHRFQQ